MDKITIIPESVRGYGDIVSPKSLEDFEVYNSELSFEDSVYTLAFDASGVSVGLTVSSGTISVGSSVTLTAEVLSEGEPASGETVSFYDGSTLLGTDTTDSSGEATYTTSSLSVGTHSLTAVALGKSSLAVSVTVNKLTSTITISVPATGTVGTSYTVSGTLTPSSGSVKLYENSVLKDTLTVSSGSFSKAITQSNEGTYSYYAVFEGSSTYEAVTSSTSSITVSAVPTPTVTTVSLTSDKSILSNYDSESAVLSATVLDDNDDPMEGVTVTFYNGSSSMGTADTNSSGVATKTYASVGAGDVTFKASAGSLFSETYVIEDCSYYIPTEYTYNSTYSSGDHFDKLNNTPITLPTNCEITFMFKSAVNGSRVGLLQSDQLNYSLWGERGSYGIQIGYRDTSSHSTKSRLTIDTNYHTYKMIRNGSSVQFYIDNTLVTSATLNWLDDYTYYLQYWVWRSGELKEKELKIKPL